MKRKIENVLIAGLLLGAGVVNAADSPFPRAAEVGPLEWGNKGVESAPAQTKSGAAQPVFPIGELEIYVTNEAPKGPSITHSAQSVFPNMAETGPNI